MEIQKITIDVPSPKFQKGTVIRYRHHSGANIVGYIHQVVCIASIHIVDGEISIEFDDAGSYYVLALQSGSTSSVGTPIRPGTTLAPRIVDVEQTGCEVLSIDELDTPLVGIDTHENIGERWRNEDD